MKRVCPYCRLDQHDDCLRHQGKRCECPECFKVPDEPLPVRYVYGLDPASKNDYFGIVVHGIRADENGKQGMPFIKTLRMLTHLPYPRFLEILENELFTKYPPALIIADYTNEKTFTDLLIDRYGEERVEPVKFTTENKKMLKDDGLSILKQGYQFPNHAKIRDKEIAELVSGTVNQLLREQLIITPSGKETFDHPQGEHNDLAVAWELSIHGCLQLTLNAGTGAVIEAGDPEIERDGYLDGENLFPELDRFSNVQTTIQNS